MLSNLLNRSIVSRGINFGDFTNQHAYDQTGSDSYESIGVTEQRGGQVVSSAQNQYATNIGTVVQSSLRIGGFAVTSKEYTSQGSNNAGECQAEYKYYAFTAGISYSAQGNSGDDCTNIGFEQVSAHTSNVAYVIAYVISDGSRVTRIVFRQTFFYFTYQVSANVSSLGIDTAANTSEQSDGGSTQGEAGYDINVAKNHVSSSNTNDTQTNNAQTHYSTAGESNFQSFRHAVTCSFSSTNVSLGSNGHTNVASANGEDCTCYEANSSHGRQEHSDNNSNNEYEYGQSFIFSVQERHSALMDVTGDFLHACSACRSLADCAAEQQSNCQCDDANNDRSH